MNSKVLNKIIYLLIYFIFMTSPSIQVLHAESVNEEDTLLLQSEVLKHRVNIVVVPQDKQKVDENTFIIRTEGWRALLMDESITVNPEEWASAVDLLKSEVNASKLFRATNMNLVPFSTKENAGNLHASNIIAPLVMLAKFGTGITGKRVFIYVIDGASGNTLYTADKLGPTMQEAIRQALTSLEEMISLDAWRCQVVDQAGNAMILDRGILDGLRKGQKLIGYAISPEALKKSPMNPELLIMRYGSRKGIYVVSEEGQEFSKVIPTKGAPILAAGDILELPPIIFKQRSRDTRGRKVWDKIYSE